MSNVVDLVALTRMRDPHGLLSVYVDADPQQQAGARPAWAVAVENELAEIRKRLEAEDDRERRMAFRRRLDLLESELGWLLDPREPGRGRALFATIDGGEVHQVALQAPFPTCAVLHETAYLPPLLAALDRGRPAGLVAVSLPEVRVLEVEQGAPSEITSFALEPETSEWRELTGQVAVNPALAQYGSQRELFERRLDEHRSRLLDTAGTRLRELAGSRSWDRIVVAGDQRLARPLAEILNGDHDVSVVDHVLATLTEREIEDAVDPVLREANLRREEKLVERARNAALSGGPGAIGLADVLTALEESRVECLLFDEQREHEGMRAPDGRLVPKGIVPPGVAAEELEPELLLTARMVERVLESGGRAIPLSEGPAEALADHDGVAALLRW